MNADQTLEQILAEYLDREATGTSPDRQQLLQLHPELAGELQEFFRNHDRMRLAADSTTGPDTTSVPLGPGSRFGDYEILSELDRGGMGIVYRARQISLHRIVALKTIKSGVLAHADEIQRFQREARAAAAVEHPNLVPVYEVGQRQGIHFFSMPLIQGESIARRLGSGPLESTTAAQIAAKLADAVGLAHAHGIVHRDLKPGNVLLDETGEPRIMDFGLAKLSHASAEVTQTGQILGTPAYMAPEQANHGEVTPSVDIYGLGAILYAMLTGRAPFDAEHPVDVLLQLRATEPVPPRRLNRSVSRTLQQICLRCLEKRPADRYRTAADLAADLRHYLRGEPLDAAPSNLWQQTRRFTRRNPVLVAHLASITSILLITCLTYLMIGQDRNYFLRYVALMSSWAGLSLVLNGIMQRATWKTAVGWIWALVDVVLLTVAILVAEPPRAPLLIGYPLLIVASSLFLRVRLVALMTALNLVACGALALAIRAEFEHPQYAILFLLGLLFIGIMLGGLVGHLRAISRFYEPLPRGSTGRSVPVAPTDPTLGA